MISIHALREEGDLESVMLEQTDIDFYPRPPRGRRPAVSFPASCRDRNFYPRPPRGRRPAVSGWATRLLLNFYPRPPRGRRPLKSVSMKCTSSFLSTPSARKATGHEPEELRQYLISIHALREEGDTPLLRIPVWQYHFYPRPPRGRRPFSMLYLLIFA